MRQLTGPGPLDQLYVADLRQKYRNKAAPLAAGRPELLLLPKWKVRLAPMLPSDRACYEK